MAKTPTPAAAFDSSMGLVLNVDGTPVEASVLTKAFLLGFQVWQPLEGVRFLADGGIDMSKTKPGAPEWHRGADHVASTEVAQRLGVSQEALAKYQQAALDPKSPWNALRYMEDMQDERTTAIVRLRLNARLREKIDVACAQRDAKSDTRIRTTLSDVVHEALSSWLVEHYRAEGQASK